MDSNHREHSEKTQKRTKEKTKEEYFDSYSFVLIHLSLKNPENPVYCIGIV